MYLSHENLAASICQTDMVSAAVQSMDQENSCKPLAVNDANWPGHE